MKNVVKDSFLTPKSVGIRCQRQLQQTLKYLVKISVSLCIEMYSMLRVETLIDTTCGNTQTALTHYRCLKPSVQRCGNFI